MLSRSSLVRSSLTLDSIMMPLLQCSVCRAVCVAHLFLTVHADLEDALDCSSRKARLHGALVLHPAGLGPAMVITMLHVRFVFVFAGV